MVEPTTHQKLLELALNRVIKVEVTGLSGREFVTYLPFEVQLQDDNRTLKLFIKQANVHSER